RHPPPPPPPGAPPGAARPAPPSRAPALAGPPLPGAGAGGQTRSLCYVDDTVAGVLALAASGESGPMNIGGADEITMLELARRVVELTGSGSRIRFVERPVDDPGRRRPDTTLARERLGWRPVVSWSEGLERTIGWFAHAVAA
ncbi:SDR family NAD-dependent epimerase/dehydratase, partial [Streptomyces sp. NPDC059409]